MREEALPAFNQKSSAGAALIVTTFVKDVSGYTKGEPDLSLIHIWQFSAERMEETLPATVYGIEKYLGSGLVKGVGPKFAKRIVQKFGKDTLDVIETNPDALSQVEGIGRVRVERIKKSWQEQKEIKNIMLFLQSHEVSTAHATKIFKTYGSDSIKDVYKRQLLYCGTKSIRKDLRLLPCIREESHCHRPVSYTHLDVYKRQFCYRL